MPQRINNNARALLTAGITAVATSITIEASKADSFPVADTDALAIPQVGKDWFKAVLQDTSGNIEIVYVRTRAAGIAILSNVIRGQEGTTALVFAAGSVCGLRLTALDHQNALAVSASATAAGLAVLNALTTALQLTALGFSNFFQTLIAAVDAPALRALIGVAPRAARIDVASVAGTVDLTTAAPNSDDIRITGALAITGFTLAEGRVMRATAGGAITLVNGANLITQTGANIVCTAGATFNLRGLTGGVVEVINFGASVLADASITAPKLSGAQTGTAPIYGVRAWVVFDGSLAGTNAPTAGGNVTSVTRTGTGQYTVNLTTAMPSANYTVVGGGSERSASGLGGYGPDGVPTTTSFNVTAADGGGSFTNAFTRMRFAIIG